MIGRSKGIQQIIDGFVKENRETKTMEEMENLMMTTESYLKELDKEHVEIIID